MSKEKIHKDNGSIRKPDVLDSLPQARIPWKRSKEEVWDSLKDSIDKKPEARKISLSSYVYRLSAAAVIILLMASAVFMRLYTRTVNSYAGEVATLDLPDGSTVTLNADTELKYKPLWWRFTREVRMEGEAFFEVERGSRFTVISEPGTTTVLGTSFNIYSRDGEYEVSCHTGRVSVEPAGQGRDIILEPEQKASLGANGELMVSEELTGLINKDWRTGYFQFTSCPVKRVFDEISRQFAINISGTENLDLIYTGNFSKDQPVKEVMTLVCKAFGIDFVKEGENAYRVITDAE